MTVKETFMIMIIFFLIIMLCFLDSLDASWVNTLNQGDKLNSSAYLVSAGKIFTLGFFIPSTFSNDSYLGIWYSNDSYRKVWVGNRNTPIADNSGVLTIDSVGKLIITHNGGDPIELYGGLTGTNIAATLFDSGNFIVTVANNNGSKKAVLWESFYYPTDTLLPGMKLGVNHRTGQKWSITSWVGQDVPASGAFTLEWDPTKRRLIVRQRGVIHWSSGVLGDKNFEFITIDPSNLNYVFTNVSTMDEEYLVIH
ncbi:G-type lectin S-receptor-like serine/threonine-protein kinase At1g67520 [Camellia sinensis]|uniref:G-type lectin S-receptor-like serine/threonine-protein kinase At1g67520 n=1 Tax=Camellia sinensis TaxID=4442 RepID=UPI00103625EB|nr:G-type lectin S-receptor-like serine/threonine-protein kinase At1g67520 [Camellia sinensis]